MVYCNTLDTECILHSGKFSTSKIFPDCVTWSAFVETILAPWVVPYWCYTERKKSRCLIFAVPKLIRKRQQKLHTCTSKIYCLCDVQKKNSVITQYHSQDTLYHTHTHTHALTHMHTHTYTHTHTHTRTHTHTHSSPGVAWLYVSRPEYVKKSHQKLTNENTLHLRDSLEAITHWP